MKVDVVNMDSAFVGKKELPAQFNELVRPDLVKRAVETIQGNRRQPYGSDPEAGKKYSSEVSRRRRKYRGSYGIGISRVPRKVMSRRGTRMNWVGATAPGTVGGRRAHPPKPIKIWSKKLNIKERRKAIRSAMASVMVKELVEKRGHILPKNYPFIIDNKFEDLTQTKQVKQALLKIGLKEELERTKEKKVRPGKGKVRGRKYKRKIGPLLVVSKDCKLLKSGLNIPGVDIVEIKNINAELLAPGADIGRLTFFTNSAIEKLEKERLFMNDYKGESQKKEIKEKPAKTNKVKPVKKETKKVEKPKTEKKSEKKPEIKKEVKTEKKVEQKTE